ncbi:MAG TPA: Uma2 family endonuclease [Polyangia bacterium]|nr:Uma2 family endonuclease [Polyangia bacterium]
MPVATAPFVSEAEFLSLPESNQKAELVDGEVIVSPSPSYWHQEVLARIVGALREWARGHTDPCTVAQAPLEVRFGSGRILQPDAMVFFARIPRDQAGPIDRIPEICIEVLSSDRAYDRITKRLLYAAAGVQEYWVVDPNAFVERWTGPSLTREELLRDALTTERLPGFSLDLPRLFADVA